MVSMDDFLCIVKTQDDSLSFRVFYLKSIGLASEKRRKCASTEPRNNAVIESIKTQVFIEGVPFYREGLFVHRVYWITDIRIQTGCRTAATVLPIRTDRPS